MTTFTTVAEDITIMPDDDGSTKVVVRFVNAATFSVPKGAYLILAFERPVTFKVVQG